MYPFDVFYNENTDFLTKWVFKRKQRILVNNLRGCFSSDLWFPLTNPELSLQCSGGSEALSQTKH